jgi:hypothetical protein
MNAVPPKISRRPAAGRLVGIIVAGTMLILAVGIFSFNPATSHFYPVCQFHRFTGLNCPGCGMTRALYALLHGDLKIALHDNVLFVGALFLGVSRSGWFALNKIRGRRNGEFFPATFLWPALVIALVFAVLRNLPAFAFLSP